MVKALAICAAIFAALALQGCGAGQITSQQQKDKADAIQKYVEAHKNEGPPREERPR